MESKVNVAVVGYGYWGPNLVRNFLENPSSGVSWICDSDAARLAIARRRHAHVGVTTSFGEALRDEETQLVAICTPVSTHFKLAAEALKAGKHVFIEKPMTASVREAEKLIDLAAQKNLQLFVDHTFIYMGAVKLIRHLITTAELGELLYFDSVRINLGLYQSDVNVIWDLAPHDLAILTHLIDERPASISAIGSSRVFRDKALEDVAYVTVRYDSGFLAHFHVNWMSPVKIRRMIIGGNRKMVVFDHLDPDEKVKVYDKGVSLMTESGDKLYRNIVQYRIGDMHSPKVDNTEALKVEAAHVVNCIRGKEQPLTGGAAGLSVVRLLEASEKSLRQGGKFVKV